MPTPVSSQEDSMPRIRRPAAWRAHRPCWTTGDGQDSEVVELQDQRVPARTVVVLAGGQLLEPEPLVERDRRLVGVADLQDHRPGAEAADRRQPGSDQARSPIPRRRCAGGHDQPVQVGQLADRR